MARPEITGRKTRNEDISSTPPPVRGTPPIAAYSIAGFCKAHCISESMFFKLKKQGRGPREMHVGDRVLISVESAAAWRRWREEDALNPA